MVRCQNKNNFNLCVITKPASSDTIIPLKKNSHSNILEKQRGCVWK